MIHTLDSFNFFSFDISDSDDGGKFPSDSQNIHELTHAVSDSRAYIVPQFLSGQRANIL